MRQLRELSRYVSAGCINMVAKLLFRGTGSSCPCPSCTSSFIPAALVSQFALMGVGETIQGLMGSYRHVNDRTYRFDLFLDESTTYAYI